MIEFFLGLGVGAVTVLPAWFAMRSMRDDARQAVVDAAAVLERKEAVADDLRLRLSARTFDESLRVEALLARPEPEPDVPGRWLHSDDGLVSTFVPDRG